MFNISIFQHGSEAFKANFYSSCCFQISLNWEPKGTKNGNVTFHSGWKRLGTLPRYKFELLVFSRRVFRLRVASLCFIFLDLLVNTLLLLRSVAFYEKRIYPLHHCWSRPSIKVKMAPWSKSRWWSSHGSVSVNYWVPLVFSPSTNPTHHKWSDYQCSTHTEDHL